MRYAFSMNAKEAETPGVPHTEADVGVVGVWFREQVAIGIAQLDCGAIVGDEDMMRWLADKHAAIAMRASRG